MRKRSAVALLIAALAACGDGGSRTASVRAENGRPPVWVAPGDLPCGRLPATLPAAFKVGRYDVVELLSVSYSQRVSSVQAWDHYLGYTVDDDRLVVCDLDTGLTATVAEAGADPRDAIATYAGSKDAVVYLRQRLPKDPKFLGQDSMTWSIEALDVRTGRRWSIDRNRSDEHAPDTDLGALPVPRVEWPWVAWMHAVDEQDAELWSFDLRTDRATVVATLPNGGMLDLAQGRIVYDRRVGDDRRDLYVVPADGSRKPERLAEIQGQWPVVGGDIVAWDDEVAPFTMPTTPPRHDSWIYSLAAKGEPIRLGPGSSPRPGLGFVVVEQDGALVLYDPERPTEPPVELVSREQLGHNASIGVSQDVLTWAVTDASGKAFTVRLLRVTRGDQ